MKVMMKKIHNGLYPRDADWVERVGVSPVFPINKISPFFREGNLREHLGNPPVKNKLLLKRRSLEKTAAKLNMGFRGQYLNENVRTRFLPSEMGMGKFGFL